ncbi:MchE protein OS=Rhodopirellula sp. SWK7 GN=RRSWK_02569 PE=4 SV=1 [Gemmata massiliana]|uniref:MchE protein n=1 Tax=Gemmata massiliana TaxID=1210884 RepID=A0A6P2DBD3_9BACT|nr:efflux RND transporter periplasmic adaptor subunit [Gemmata massiliana]VTR98988.1 MchE protein OS=Rhodopirellula sp. SWK7 GN=RRSWK_02569 PE=4 SV=1 [Gemmata massiliana]
MRLRPLVTPAITVVVLGTIGAVGYRTHEKWVPIVFPSKTAAPESGAHDEGGHDHAGHDHGNRTDRVKLSPQAQKNLGLDVDTLTPEDYWRKLLIPGVVVDRPGESDRSVTSKVAGVVIDIKARPGDTVRAGAPLFTLQLASEFIQAAQTDLAKTAREIEFAITKRDRVANLVKQGTQPGAALTEEENQIKRLTVQLQAYRRQLQVFGLTSEQVTRAEKGEVITELVIAAPDRLPVPVPASTNSPSPALQVTLYEVQDLKVSLGDQVQVGQILCQLANHQQLFVEGRAFKSEAGALAFAAEKKVPVRIEFADEANGEWPELEPRTIHHLSNQVDTATRTFAFYLPLENQPRTFERDGKTHFVWRFRPGQRVRIKLPVERFVVLAPDGKSEVRPFVLPAGAVVREGPEAFVFVQTGDVFVRKPVRVLHENRTETVIANDGSVTEVDFVVKNQAAAINRALKAAAAGGEGGHGHDHAGHSH